MPKHPTYQRHAALLCALIMLWCLLLPHAAHADNEEGSTAYVKATHLILRKKPREKGAPITQMKQNEAVKIISLQGEWVYVSYKKHKGYVKGEYLTLRAPGSAETAQGGNAHATSSALRREDRGADVQALQQLLRGAGYDVGSDGVFGKKTEDALIAFQKKHGLKADGKAGAQTMDKLRAVSAAAAPATDRAPGSALRLEDRGDAVRELQQLLRSAGYSVGVDGVFGASTESAVIAFQKQCGLNADGLAGTQTVALLRNPSSASVYTGSGNVELLDWWNGGSRAFPVSAKATVVDVRTGVRFTIRRWGGVNHADCEPMSVADTNAMKRAYGGAWSWERRPIWVITGGRVIAASMNGMPHMGDGKVVNNFNGHFCIHMKNSRTHGSNRVDEGHAAAVSEAYSKRNNY